MYDIDDNDLEDYFLWNEEQKKLYIDPYKYDWVNSCFNQLPNVKDGTHYQNGEF